MAREVEAAHADGVCGPLVGIAKVGLGVAHQVAARGEFLHVFGDAAQQRLNAR